MLREYLDESGLWLDHGGHDSGLVGSESEVVELVQELLFQTVVELGVVVDFGELVEGVC